MNRKDQWFPGPRGGRRELITKGHGGMFLDDGNVLLLDCSDGYLSNSSNHIFKRVHFIVYDLYFNEFNFKN